MRPLVIGMENAWTLEIDDIARQLNVDLHSGLTQKQVAQALEKYGKNGNSTSPIISLLSALLIWRFSVARGFTYAIMEVSVGTIQGSVSVDIIGLGNHFLYLGHSGGW